MIEILHASPPVFRSSIKMRETVPPEYHPFVASSNIGYGQTGFQHQTNRDYITPLNMRKAQQEKYKAELDSQIAEQNKRRQEEKDKDKQAIIEANKTNSLASMNQQSNWFKGTRRQQDEYPEDRNTRQQCQSQSQPQQFHSVPVSVSIAPNSNSNYHSVPTYPNPGDQNKGFPMTSFPANSSSSAPQINIPANTYNMRTPRASQSQHQYDSGVQCVPQNQYAPPRQQQMHNQIVPQFYDEQRQ